MLWKHLFLVLSSPLRLTIYLMAVILSGWIWWNFTDIEIIFGNYGYWYGVIDVSLSIITILVFPLFIIAWIYRSYVLGGGGQKRERIGFFSGIIGVIISGSSCCGLTLATYF